MARLFNVVQVYRDNLGNPLANGTLTFFTNTTTTKVNVFSDAALTVAQANPLTLNAFGEMTGNVFYSGTITVRVQDEDGGIIRTDDNVVGL